MAAKLNTKKYLTSGICIFFTIINKERTHVFMHKRHTLEEKADISNKTVEGISSQSVIRPKLVNEHVGTPSLYIM